MRWGLIWFVVTIAAAVLARPLLAAVLALAAALAADQVLRLRDAEVVATTGGKVGGLLSDPRRLPALLGAAALPLAAGAGGDTLAAALGALVVVVLGQRVCTTGAQPQRANGVADASFAILVAVTLGAAAAGPVLVRGFGAQAAVVVLILVCAYDAADFLIGSGSSTSWEGPAAGIVTVGVVSFALSVVPLEPVDAGATYALGALTAVLAPLGPPAASLLVGSGRRPARHLRRLDSLLVLGPVVPYVLAAIL